MHVTDNIHLYDCCARIHICTSQEQVSDVEMNKLATVHQLVNVSFILFIFYIKKMSSKHKYLVQDSPQRVTSIKSPITSLQY
jgi:hypothetical protein